MKNLDTNKVTIASLLITFGIIFGDIGTSPLYVLKAVIGSREINETLVFGGISCVFWTLFFQTYIKYVWLTLKADNQGEGGIFSLYSLIKRKGKKLLIPTIVGAAALLADGIITPPVSISSAVEGLRMIPVFMDINTIPIILCIITILFLFQRFGTEKVGKIFGPFMFIWFSMLLILGLNYILKYPEILKALNPYYAYELLVNYPHGFWLLGAVFLCTTGAEALYSDLGHCGRKNIRISWIYVKIALVTNYLGQAAWLMHQNQKFLDERNPFFELMPQWFLLTGICIATLAAVIASQALITGTFTLINEAKNLNIWPRVYVVQPNENRGQIYIPSINFILWLGCCFVVLYFKNSSHMEAAYGLAITVTMLMTTYLLAYYLHYYLPIKKIFIYLIIAIFFTIETSFFIANFVKIQEGGYIALIIGGIFFVVMYSSFFGRKINNQNRKFVHIHKHIPLLTQLTDDKTVNKYATFLYYLTLSEKNEEIEASIINSIFSRRPKRADVYWFFHINRVNAPYTLNYELIPLVENKIYRININIGFRIQPKTEWYAKEIFKDLIQNGELKLNYQNEQLKKYNDEPDMKFIILEKFPSIESSLNTWEKFVIKIYSILKKVEYNIPRSFGIDKNDVVVEQIPMIHHPHQRDNFERIK